MESVHLFWGPFRARIGVPTSNQFSECWYYNGPHIFVAWFQYSSEKNRRNRTVTSYWKTPVKMEFQFVLFICFGFGLHGSNTFWTAATQCGLWQFFWPDSQGQQQEARGEFKQFWGLEVMCSKPKNGWFGTFMNILSKNYISFRMGNPIILYIKMDDGGGSPILRNLQMRFWSVGNQMP